MWQLFYKKNIWAFYRVNSIFVKSYEFARKVVNRATCAGTSHDERIFIGKRMIFSKV